ncbi:MAG: HAMP domain-containing sensor histidine kinase, partial [Proteobacteria bacterium]|nr:HAMP domain-containing sensor histidine kinase [Pseudomonadota bacterium]
RLGMAGYTLLLTMGSVLASLLISFIVYYILDFDPFTRPVAIILPILCPLLISPPLIVHATRTSLHLRYHRRRIVEQNQAIGRILTEKDRIITLVGHDLRSQLNLIMGFAQLISRQADTMPNDRLVDYANEIHNAGRKTTDVLSDLLNWGRAQAGQLHADLEGRPFDEVVGHAVDALRPDADRKQVVVHLTSPLAKDNVDHVVIGSALRNVLSNAIKFSHTGGTVTVEATKVGEELLLKVIDAGVGIKSEKLAQLRAGHLVESTEGTEHEAGSGLGLAICRDIVEAQGGRLQLESEPGRGATVTIVIPLQ